MKKQLKLIFILPILLAGSCSTKTQKTRSAPEALYYVDIRKSGDHKFITDLAAFLESEIPKKKYTFTYQSSKVWPYYQSFGLTESISPDSLMPPHTFIHRLQVMDPAEQISIGEHVIRIDLNSPVDTLPNYKLDMFEMDSSGLVFTASTGVHYIDTAGNNSRSDIFRHCLQAIVRYSFK